MWEITQKKGFIMESETDKNIRQLAEISCEAILTKFSNTRAYQQIKNNTPLPERLKMAAIELFIHAEENLNLSHTTIIRRALQKLRNNPNGVL